MLNSSRHVCSECNNSFATRQSLWNHKQHCQGDQSLIGRKRPRTLDIPTYIGSTSNAKRPRSPEIPTFNESVVEKDPKIQNLLDAIINDSSESQRPIESTTTIQNVPEVLNRLAAQNTQQQQLFTPQIVPLQQQVPAADTLWKKCRERDTVKKSKKVKPQKRKLLPKTVRSKKVRSKGDIIGYDGFGLIKTQSRVADDNDSESDDSIDISDIKPRNDDADDEDDESVTDEDSDSEPDEIVIPDTVEALRNRFNKLYVRFTRENKHEHIHELTLLLDEMLKHEVVTSLDYTRLNSLIAEKLPERASDKEDEDEDEEDYEKTTFDYVIQHDREELFELLEELKEDEEFVEEALKLEELIQIFLKNEFSDDKPTKKMAEDVIEKLESKNISKSQKHRLKMLLDDIAENRYRIQSIFTRLFDTENSDQMLTTLKLLKDEKLLSAEQFERLSELEEPDAPTIAAVVKGTKIGQGLKFLPREINMLRESLHSLLADLEEKGSAVVKDKLVGVLEELSKRHAISEMGYNSIKETL